MTTSIPILSIGDTLMCTVHIELDDAVAQAFQNDVLLAITTSGNSITCLQQWRPRTNATWRWSRLRAGMGAR